MTHVTSLGRLLIALRIARRMSQEQRAERLGVDAHEVATDEHNEYYGVTWDRIQAICDALGVRITTNVEEAPEHMRELEAVLAD